MRPVGVQVVVVSVERVQAFARDDRQRAVLGQQAIRFTQQSHRVVMAFQHIEENYCIEGFIPSLNVECIGLNQVRGGPGPCIAVSALRPAPT